MSWRVLLTDRAWPDSSVEQRELAAVGAELIEAPDGSESTLTRLAVDVDAIMTCWAPVTEEIVRAAVKCRHIARMGIGLDNIAVSVATERRIRRLAWDALFRRAQAGQCQRSILVLGNLA